MKRFLLIISLISVLNCVFVGRVFAQEAGEQRVGVVFSGGGAKGLYHVGILKALEDNNVPIDYISGASMGAIVAGMYASGYSPEEMIQFFITDSVQTWLTGEIPNQYTYYFKRYDPTPEMIGINITGVTNNEVASKFQLPTNAISPYRIDLAFMSMLQGASWAANENFDQLMVPFRCVAADGYHKKEVVFKNGSLPFAIRASMTIPFAFTPLKKDSILLYDGGLYNNFPWQTLQDDFAPDIIIGGSCSENFPNPKIDDPIGQLATLITKNTDYNLPGKQDVMIHRLLPEVDVLDYSQAPLIIAKGYEDAMKQMDVIKKRIKRNVSKKEITRKRQEFKKKIKPIMFEEVIVEGLRLRQTAYVYKQLDIEGRKLISPEYFEQQYLKILATKQFKAEFPIVEFNPETGYYKVRIKLDNEPLLKISIGGNISSTALNQGYIGLNFKKVARMASNYYARGYFGNLYSRVAAGARYDMYGNKPYYVQYDLSYSTASFDNNNTYAYYRNKDFRYKNASEIKLKGMIAIPILENWALRGTLEFNHDRHKYYQTLYTSADTPDINYFTAGKLSADLTSQELNFSLYSNQGFRKSLQVSVNTGSEKFTPGTTSVQDPLSGKNRTWVEARALAEEFFYINKWFNLGYRAELAISNTPKFATDIMTSIYSPAFTPTVHSSTLFMPEFRSPSYIGLGIYPIFKLHRNEKFYIKTYFSLFIPQEIVYEDKWVAPTANRIKQYVKGMFGATIVYQTPIGPLSGTVVKYTTGPKNWTYMINFGYILFPD